MHRSMAHAGVRLRDTFSIWEQGRFCARPRGATMTMRAAVNRSGFERAAEDPLGARE